MAALELVVLLGVVILGCGLAAHRTGVAAPILLLFAGTLLGFVPATAEVRLPPELMLLALLTALLYWESITTSLRGIRAALRGILLTSTLLVVITAGRRAGRRRDPCDALGPAWVLGGAILGSSGSVHPVPGTLFRGPGGCPIRGVVEPGWRAGGCRA